MKAVKVQYTVQPEYAEQNKANIRKVMAHLKANPVEGMFYSSHVLDDGQTFVHINIARDEATMSKLNEVEAFSEFRMALKASGPVTPPAQTNLNVVDAGFPV